MMNLRVIFLLCFTIALHITLSVSVWGYTLDDAFITFRYVKNTFQFGPSFNESTLVEGYTSPLFLLALCLYYLISPELEFGAKVIGVSLNSLTLIGIFFVARRVLEFKDAPPWAHVLPAILTAASPHFIYSSVEGLETCLLNFLVTALLYLSVNRNFNRPYLCGTVIALLYMSRPDAILYGGSTLIALALLSRVNKRILSRLCAPILLIVLTHILLRYAYYGDILPNTFYAKTSGTLNNFDLGSKRLIQFLYRSGEFLLAPILCYLIVTTKSSKLRASIFALLAFIAPRIFFHLYSGGEVMGFDRFLTPTIPVAALLWTLSLTALCKQKQPNLAKLLQPIVLAYLFVSLAFRIDTFLSTIAQHKSASQHLHAQHGEVGMWIDANLKPGAVVAAADAGLIFYNALDIEALDILGINDRHIAKLPGKWIPQALSSKVDVEYVLARKNPEVVILRARPEDGEAQLIEQEIIRHHLFREKYSCVFQSRNGWLRAFSRNRKTQEKHTCESN